MNDRSYLSIGDVLTLLQEEFPDVTISKIRFLESRGLLIPERTPSGYRKFYDHDVDRLRWILRQQRENFLPLKVIKGRLEGKEPSSQPSTLFEVAESDEDCERPPRPAGREGANGSFLHEEQLEPSAVSAAPAWSVQTTTVTTAQAAPRVSAGAGHISARPAGVDQPADLGLPASPANSASGNGGGSSGKAVLGIDEDQSGRTTVAGSPDSAGSGRRGEIAAPAGAGSAGQGSTPVASPTPVASTGRAANPGSVANRPPTPASPSPGGDDAPAAGTSLTIDELASASGLDAQQIEELVSYGLMESHSAAGVRCFDERALVVAGLAAGFARFGVEARHLKMFKHAAERQASLYSQIVMPLLRQRNPEARRRAHDDLVRLTELGSSMQACFAKDMLRDTTP